MTNTKPTWEDEYEKFKFIGDHRDWFTNPYFEEIKAFIKLVELSARQEFYEQGYKDGENNKYPLIERDVTPEEVKKAVERLASIKPCEGCEKCKS